MELKDSGISWMGFVPKRWNVQRLKNVLVDRNESNDPIKTDFILSLTNDRGVIPYSERGDVGNKSKDDVTGYKLAYPGDIVLNSMNVIIGSVGLSNYFGAVSPVYYMLYPRNKADEVKYYNYIFQTREFQQSLKGYGNGIMEIRMRIPIGNLNNIMLPIPSPTEQKAIADYLDKECARIDDIVEKQRNIIEKLKEYKKSVITEAVTKGLNPAAKMKDSGIEWIGKIPVNWEVCRIKNMASFINGYAFKSDELKTDKEVPVIRISDIQNGGIDYSTCLAFENDSSLDFYCVKARDIIIAMSGATTGKTAIVDSERKAFINQRVGIIRNAPKYVFYCLNTYRFTEYVNLISAGSAQPNISMGQIMNFVVPYISTEEQQVISNYLDQKCAEIDSVIEKREKMIDLLTEYKKSLIYECVTGKKEVA